MNTEMTSMPDWRLLLIALSTLGKSQHNETRDMNSDSGLPDNETLSFRHHSGRGANQPGNWALCSLSGIAPRPLSHPSERFTCCCGEERMWVRCYLD